MRKIVIFSQRIIDCIKFCGLHRLRDRKFSIYLNFFHQLMPHVDILYAQLQEHQVCSTFIQTCLQNFVKYINNVREKIPDIFNNTSCTMSEEPLAKRPRSLSIDEETSLIFEEGLWYHNITLLLTVWVYWTFCCCNSFWQWFILQFWTMLPN